MAKKTQPKVSDLVEILIQQMNQFEKVMTERNQALTTAISKLEYLKVDFDRTELEAIKESNREQLKEDFEALHAQTKTNKKVSAKSLLYLIVLNVFFLSTAILCVYMAIDKTQYQSVVKERNELKSEITSINKFLNENTDSAEAYKEWLKN
tara:strand:+ start:4987 stop:5439 length:453 start_codon:yes stop_codon:yes gene_type:complete